MRSLIESERDAAAPTPRGVFRAVLRAYAEAQGKRRIGEKTPGHHGYLSTLLAWFPDARVIVIERDPRAVVASKLKSPWAQRRAAGAERGGAGVAGIRGRGLHRVAVHAQEWAAAYERNLSPWRRDPRVRWVTYEALTDDSEAVLRTLCEHVGEAFHEAVRGTGGSGGGGSGAEAAAPPGVVGDAELDRWREDHHRRAESPVNRASREKWRSQLSATEVALVEGWCARGMQQGGHEPTAPAWARAAGRASVATLLRADAVEERLAAGLERVRRSGAGRLRRVARAAGRRLPGSRSGGAGLWNASPPTSSRRRAAAADASVRLETIHPATTASHPLPINVGSRDELPAEAGWWGYSFRDVPERRSGATFLLTVPEARIISYRDPAKGRGLLPRRAAGRPPGAGVAPAGLEASPRRSDA